MRTRKRFRRQRKRSGENPTVSQTNKGQLVMVVYTVMEQEKSTEDDQKEENEEDEA